MSAVIRLGAIAAGVTAAVGLTLQPAGAVSKPAAWHAAVPAASTVSARAGAALRTGSPAVPTPSRIQRCWQPAGRGVSLTFDDSGSTAQVKRIVAVLDRNHVRGRFFPVGSWVRTHRALVRYIEAHGHAVGNHTYDHPDLTRVSDTTLRWEIRNGAKASGTPKLLRPPYGAGAFSARIRKAAAQQGLKVCFWTVDTRDWSGASARTIVRRVLYGDATTPPARKDGVVLMHMFGAHTAAALQPMIDGLRARHIKLESK
jgi:peptidoglycan/xylan/chitin deacetylase (PgdA/CDA1 family)